MRTMIVVVAAVGGVVVVVVVVGVQEYHKSHYRSCDVSRRSYDCYSMVCYVGNDDHCHALLFCHVIDSN